MKEFLKNFAIISVVVALFLFVMFRSVETAWTPMRRTEGNGAQAVGEADLVLPSGGESVITAQMIPVYDMGVSGMTDADKLALISEILTDAFKYFGELDDSQVWKGVAVCIDNIVEYKGVET